MYFHFTQPFSNKFEIWYVLTLVIYKHCDDASTDNDQDLFPFLYFYVWKCIETTSYIQKKGFQRRSQWVQILYKLSQAVFLSEDLPTYPLSVCLQWGLNQYLSHVGHFLTSFWEILRKLRNEQSLTKTGFEPAIPDLNARLLTTIHNGAICQFPVRWIYYLHSSESIGK